MKAFIEYPEISQERIEVTGDLWVVTHDRHVDEIIEKWEAKNNGGSKE
jgi:hypothetical protein